MKNIANYIVEDDPIAVGGMGRIYKGQDPLGNRVAIKEILPEYATDLSILARIDKEVEFLMRVEHPSIVKLYSAFRDPQTNAYFIVMELVEGKNIEEYVSAYGPIPFHIAVELMKRILDAMQCVSGRKFLRSIPFPTTRLHTASTSRSPHSCGPWTTPTATIASSTAPQPMRQHSGTTTTSPPAKAPRPPAIGRSATPSAFSFSKASINMPKQVWRPMSPMRCVATLRPLTPFR